MSFSSLPIKLDKLMETTRKALRMLRQLYEIGFASFS